MTIPIVSRSGELTPQPVEVPDAQEIRQKLLRFYMTNHYYRHWTGRLLWTDGIQYLADACGAHWLIDIVASYQPRVEKFQIWRLTMLPEEEGEPMAVVEMGEDTTRDGKLVHWKDDQLRARGIGYAALAPAIRQTIPFTDFPLREGVELYFENGVLLLKGER